MVKMIVLLYRRADIEVDEFRNYWQTTHARFGRELPGVLRYVQNVPLGKGSRRSDVPDGVAELWFEDKAAIKAAFSSPAGMAGAEDAKNFVDVERMATMVVEEHEMLA